jgi:hypothetical protein
VADRTFAVDTVLSLSESHPMEKSGDGMTWLCRKYFLEMDIDCVLEISCSYIARKVVPSDILTEHWESGEEG